MSQAKQGTLRAGSAQMEITPRGLVQLSGDVGLYRPGRFVLDPLYARALVLQAGERTLCLVVCDVTLLTRRYADQMRNAAAQILGTDPGAVMIHGTQTHSAPSIGHCIISDDYADFPAGYDWLRGGDEAWSAWASEQAIEAVRRAQAALRPVQLAVGRGVEGRLAHNRRAVGRDGKVFMPGPHAPRPLGWSNLAYLEGPIDPELGVLALRGEDLSLAALLVHYTCHPVHVFPKPIVSADWPGALVSELVARLGDCHPLVVNGCCGNINPWPPFELEYDNDHRRMGSELAAGAERILSTLAFEEVGTLDWRSVRLPIPLRVPEPERVARARAYLAEHPEPVWEDAPGGRVSLEWVLAHGLLDLATRQQREPEHDYEVQIFRIGDAALVGLPGEPFVEGQLQLKLASPARQTIVAHMINQYLGYIPTLEAFRRGGHELTTGNWSRLVPEALDMIVARATELLTELFPDRSAAR